MPEFNLPKPSPRVWEAKQTIGEETGRDVSDTEAAEARERIMRFLYLMNNPSQDLEQSTSAIKGKTARTVTRAANKHGWKRSTGQNAIVIGPDGIEWPAE